MPEWAWVVVAGLTLAILTPPTLGAIKYVRKAVAEALAQSIAQAIVDELIALINGKLGLTELKQEVAEVKLHMVNLEGQVEALINENDKQGE